MTGNIELSFTNSFWETDFNGTLGFDVLCRRLRDGQKTCKEIEDFFKKLAKAELQYGKTLKTLTRPCDGKDEISALGDSWHEFKAQIDKAADFHESASTKYNILADQLSIFSEDIKTQSKQIEDKVKERQKQKRTAHIKMQEVQRAYQEKCRELLVQENQYDVAKQSIIASVKEIEKVRIRAEKCREAVERADTAYKQAVEALEQSRKYWEREMEESCELYQKQEEDRIFILRDFLWKCTNIASQLCVDRDESCECVRTHLENCKISQDIHDFIIENMTGSNRPEPIPYENYFDVKQNDTQRGSPSSLTFAVSPTIAIRGKEGLYSELQ